MTNTVDYKEDKKKMPPPDPGVERVEITAPVVPASHHHKKLYVLLTGGGSGGHVNPLLAVTEDLLDRAKQNGYDLSLHYLGPKDDYSEVLAAANIKVGHIVGAKWRRYASFQNVFDIFGFFIGFFQALIKLLILMPDVIFSKGGTGALPVVLVGWLYRIPIFVHESDAIPGLTNAISGRLAKRIAVSFERAKNYFPARKTALVGTPIRESLLKNPISQKEAKKILGFEPEEPLVLVLGGSQGAKALNEFMITNLTEITQLTQLLHQTGTTHFAEMQRLSRAALLEIATATGVPKRYHPVAYLSGEEMKQALTAADLVVSRSGSGALFEIAAFKKPAILIPIPGSPRDHQRLNAYEFVKSGGAAIIEQTNLMPGIFLTQLQEILKNEATLTQMSAGSASFLIPNAASLIAQEIITLSGK